MPYRYQRGMGSPLDPQSQQIAAMGTAGAAAAATAIVGSIASSGGTILGIAASSLVPFVGPIIAAASFGIQQLIAHSGCGPTCVQSSTWANQAEPLLAENIRAYFALPAPRTDIQKAVSLANFDSVWQKLQELCGQPEVGDAGRRCISDRQSGSCVWRQRGDSPLLAYPSEPQPGECWNWFSGYRDPIANDQTVPESLAFSAVNQLNQVAASAGVSPALLLVGAGILLLAAAV